MSKAAERAGETRGFVLSILGFTTMRVYAHKRILRWACGKVSGPAETLPRSQFVTVNKVASCDAFLTFQLQFSNF